jgi:fermentation-respiration switch protein FrsA (DUF1100 family)
MGEPNSPAVQIALEQALQDAFVRGEFDRLLVFACLCASQTLESRTPQRWREALDLAHRRALKRIAPADYARELRAVKAQLPIAATVIGLKHGVPSAATLLAIVAALDPGPLSAALGASSHQRLHARLKAQELDGESFALAEPVVVDVDRGRVVNRPVARPTTVEAETARWQLAVWSAMGNPAVLGR